MTKEEILTVEDTVNAYVRAGLPVRVTETTPQAAREMGAMALFGEKYGETVRVVDMGGESVELCGGTHLDNTAKVGWFKILSETGVAAGVRRIEAVTGKAAEAYNRNVEEQLNEAAALLKTGPENLLNRISSLINEKNDLQKQLDKLREKERAAQADYYQRDAETIKGIKDVAAALEGGDTENQRGLADKLRERLGSGLVILCFTAGEKATLIVTATDDIVKAGVHCGNIVKETAKAFGGNGGGKPGMAQAGLPAAVAKEALGKAKSFI
jgi:alanyl-tRNA synthetase